MTRLAEELGHGPDAKLVIVNCDDLGGSGPINSAIYQGMREGLATSATLMTPCPAAEEAAAEYGSGDNVGVHLTLNAEWETTHWGPLTEAASLRDSRGSFPRTIEALWAQADLTEIEGECRAQVESALSWGIDVTHLDSHMGALQLNAAFYEVYVALASEYRLPLRMAPAAAQDVLGFPFWKIARERQLVFPDYFVYSEVGSRPMLEKTLPNLRPGVTEFLVHPSLDRSDTRANYPDWRGRVDDHALLNDPAIRSAIEAAGATLISFRELRDLQRSRVS